MRHVRAIAVLVALAFFAIYVGAAYLLSQHSIATPLERLVTPGTRISNFLLQSVNQNGTVSGLLYIEYPLAYPNGTQMTLRVGDTIGYACNGTEWILASVNPANGTAVFSIVTTTSGPCPV